MPLADLKGKTVMVAAADKYAARHLAKELEKLGATVVYSKRSPHHPGAVPVIEEEVKNHVPKIDALIIHVSNVELEESHDTAVQLIQNLKAHCPVIVCDFCKSKVAIQGLQEAGAKYLNYLDLENNQIAAAVADTVAQQGKAGRTAG